MAESHSKSMIGFDELIFNGRCALFSSMGKVNQQLASYHSKDALKHWLNKCDESERKINQLIEKIEVYGDNRSTTKESLNSEKKYFEYCAKNLMFFESIAFPSEDKKKEDEDKINSKKLSKLEKEKLQGEIDEKHKKIQQLERDQMMRSTKSKKYKDTQEELIMIRNELTKLKTLLKC